MCKLNCFFGICFFILFSVSSALIGQTKEYEKLKDLVDKGKFDKAEEYCKKVTAPLEPKAAAKFYALVGVGYYNKKNYPKAAEMILKSEDKKTAQKLAKEFENKKNDFYNIKTAGKLYKIAKDYEKSAAMLFQEGEYEEASQVSPTPRTNLKFGKQLFNQGKITESLYFLKRAKEKGQKFSDDTVLTYFYGKRDYKTAYSLHNAGEGAYYSHIQGEVIEKMLEKKETMPFITHFLDSVGVKGNKQWEALLSAMVNNNLYEKAEAYCLEQKASDQTLALTYLADITTYKHPGISAWANLKLGKAMFGKQQITNYLLKSAIEYNGKWGQEPIPKKYLQSYYTETKVWVDKCEEKYCEYAKFAESAAKTKTNEYAKDNPEKSDEHALAAVFLKYVVKTYCK